MSLHVADRSRWCHWQYVAYLDDTVEQQLLRKVGGGYIFRHRLLQDYFASLDIAPPHDLAFREEARSVLQNVPNGDPLPKRKHISRSTIDDTMLLDAFFHSDSPARQF